jgi:hypothetical protein
MEEVYCTERWFIGYQKPRYQNPEHNVMNFHDRKTLSLHTVAIYLISGILFFTQTEA